MSEPRGEGLSESTIRSLFVEQARTLPRTVDVVAILNGARRRQRRRRLLSGGGVLTTAAALVAVTVAVTSGSTSSAVPSVTTTIGQGLGPLVTRVADPGGQYSSTGPGQWDEIAGGTDGHLWALRAGCFGLSTCTLSLADSTDNGRSWTLHPAPKQYLPSNLGDLVRAIYADGNTVWMFTGGEPSFPGRPAQIGSMLLTGVESGKTVTWHATPFSASNATYTLGTIIDHRLVVAYQRDVPPSGCFATRTAVATIDSEKILSVKTFSPATPGTNIAMAPDGSVWQSALVGAKCSKTSYNYPHVPRSVSVIAGGKSLQPSHQLPAEVSGVSPADAKTAWATANAGPSGHGLSPVYVTHDGGATWHRVTVKAPISWGPTPLSPSSLLVLQHSTAQNAWVYRVSRNDGQTTPPPSLEVIPAEQFPPLPTRLANGNLAFLLANRLTLSTDGGVTWHDEGLLPTRMR